ncbi:MAG: hypothetical protein CMJ84_06320 [Planctomycetes bacterium]|nr:hypothetical protein [Planctomycetota bacterium]
MNQRIFARCNQSRINHLFCLFFAFSILTVLPFDTVVANPIFTFVVKVKNEDGSAGEDGLKITIKNESRDLEIIGILGQQEDGSGSCAVTFVDLDEGRKVADIGDQTTIEVRSAQGKLLAQTTYQITASDVADARSVIDIRIEPVYIQSVSISAEIARSGDTLVFSLVGTPEEQALVSVAGVFSNLKLEEKSAGEYTANYTVKDGDNASEVPIVFQLSAQRNSKETITIDTLGPPPPTQLKVDGGQIDLNNLNAVTVSGVAQPYTDITLSLADSAGTTIEERVKAKLSGRISAKFDATKLIDGTITISAQQDPDKAGNLGEVGTITVEKDTPDAIFTLKASQEVQKAAVGVDANFVLLILGQNGFSQPINFSVDLSTLPEGASATFNPVQVAPSADEPLRSTTLSVSTEPSTPSGDHNITVLAISGNKQLNLTVTLTIEKLGAFMMLNLDPSAQAAFGQTIRAFGSVILIDEKGDSRTNLPIQLVTVSPDKTNKVYEVTTKSDRTYELEGIVLDQVGSWTIKSTWAGDVKYSSVEDKESIEVTKAKPKLVWVDQGDANPEVTTLGTSAVFALKIEPKIEDTTILLSIFEPGKFASEKIRLTTDKNGIIMKELDLNTDGTWALQAEWEGNENYMAAKSLEHQTTVTKQLGKAIVVLGGGDEDHNVSWKRFESTVNHAYQTLLKRRLTDDDIYFLSPTKTPDATVDERTSEFGLEKAITNWAKNRVSANVPLWIYMMSHNTNTSFLLTESDQNTTYLEAEKFAGWLDQIPDTVQVTIIIEACYSGNFIPVIGKNKNRVIITSADESHQAQIHRSSSFSRYFFEDVRRNMTIADAFEDVTKRMRRNVIHSSQNPKLESNGNGIPNQPSDYVGVEDLYVPDNIEPLTKPIMTDLSASELEKGISVSLFSVRIPGSAVMSEVRATVIPPDFDPGKSFDGWTAFDTFGLTDPDGDRVFTGSYTKFTKSGNYSIMVDATDEHGNTADPLQITLTVEGEAPKPKLMGDVNGDNMVNIFDLVIAAGQFGQTGSGLMGDVNSDSSVNIFDLVMVAGNFGKTAAAPMLLADPISTRQLSDLARDSNPHRLQQAIIALEQQPDSQIAIQALKQILSVMQKPEKTQLLQNYPNPFNPETWIPFELAQDTGVTIEIYSFDGQLVRKLDLGYLSAGLYLSQDRAAYWDGKSDLGETVATGVYFVKFTANGHAQTRRLVILK